MKNAKALKTAERKELLETLEARFEKHPKRHTGIDWADVQERLEASPDALRSLHEMERTGGEPDVVGRDAKTRQFVFVDCSAESPSGRRSLCYDAQARNERKEAKPKGSAVAMATDMGIEMLTEDEYRALQELGPFDTKTSSWLATPADIRKLGGAIFGDYRYGRVFTYHNGAMSYYAARGFRGSLKV